MMENAASTRDTAPDEAETLTLSQAAARLGISEKTLRKRIHAGEIAGEKLPLEGGGVGWAVHLARDISERDGNAPEVATEAKRNIAPEAHRKSFDSEIAAKRKRAESGTVNGMEVTETRAGSVPEVETESESARVLAASEAAFLRDALKVSRENETFLRGLIEQRDRDAAELRAALRTALNAMPKAIEAREYSRGDGAKLEQVGTGNAGAHNAAQATKTGAAGKVTGAAKSSGKREPRPFWKVILGVR